MATVLSMTPTNFSASNGKLSSDKNYIFGDSGGDYYLPLGPTIIFNSIGGYRFALGGVSYGSPNNGISFSGPAYERLDVNGS